MLTPIELQSKTFKSGGLGYDKKDVDGFMKEVLQGYETLYRENMELSDKISVLNEGIQYYKTIEKTLQKALVLAEKTAEDTRIAALREAKSIENEAHTKAQLIVADAKNELEHIHKQTIQVLQQYEKYKAQFKNLAAAQIEVLESDSFSINIARVDTFTQDFQTHEKHKKAYNIDLKKVAREENLVKSKTIESNNVFSDNKGSFPSNDMFEVEASITREDITEDDSVKEDGFDFINVEEDN